MSSMRQAVIRAPDRFEVQVAPRPALQHPGEVLVRTLACGICSGDLMPWYLAKKVGTVLGHEPVGRVVAVGPEVEHLRVGDLAFVHHHAPCLACPECLRGAAVHCSTWKRSSLDPGGMAEFIRVPAEIVRADAFAVPELAPEQALFIEPLGCCVKAFERVGGRRTVAGTRVIVVGCGVMGLLNLQVARAYGASEVIAVEPDPIRLEWASHLGALTCTPEEAAKRYARQADLVVIGPGFPPVIRQALDFVRNAGTACLFTPTATGITTELDLGDLYFREVSLIPSYSCGPSDTLEAARLLRTQAVVGPISHRFPLDEVQQAFDTARSGGAAVKVIVTFPEEPIG
ncbi:MAG: alcohol dehydrogenase catalytic domain-containing protein [Gemmataceae bacterium]